MAAPVSDTLLLQITVKNIHILYEDKVGLVDLWVRPAIA